MVPFEQIVSNAAFPDSKVHGPDIRHIWGRQDPGGSHVGPINFAIWVIILINGLTVYGL